MWGRSFARAVKSETGNSKPVSFLRDFFAYMGPALIVSVAYMDPGNYGTDLVAGASYKLDLVWAVWLASGMAMLLQYLSGKLGIATGKSLSELVHDSLHRNSFIVLYWLAAESAAAATDLAEYLGTVIALHLLFDVPLLYAAIFGALDVVILLALTSRRFRIVEHFFMLLVSVIGFGFLYESIVIQPDMSQLLQGTFLPSIPDTTAALIVVGIIGATVMPHALFVHSELVKNKVKTGTIEEKRRIRKLHLAENVILLAIAGVINVSILVVSTPLFPNANLTIQEAFHGLAAKFGMVAAVVFVITLLASGLTSSVTGTIAGQSIMDGLIGRKVSVWVRRVVTRFVNVIPTTVAILIGLDPLSLLVYSQVILSIMIPLPMIPLVYYTSKKRFMGEFVNRNYTIALALITASLIMFFNFYLISQIAIGHV